VSHSTTMLVHLCKLWLHYTSDPFFSGFVVLLILPSLSFTPGLKPTPSTNPSFQPYTAFFLPDTAFMDCDSRLSFQCSTVFTFSFSLFVHYVPCGKHWLLVGFIEHIKSTLRYCKVSPNGCQKLLRRTSQLQSLYQRMVYFTGTRSLCAFQL